MKKLLPHILFTALYFVYTLTLSAQNTLGISVPGGTNYPQTNLGDATMEAGTGNRAANNIEAWDKFTTTVPYTITNFFLYQNVTGASGTMHIGLYMDASGPSTLVPGSDGGSITLSASSGWINYNVTPFFLAPGTYWIAFTFSNTPPNNWTRKAAVATQYFKLGVGFASLPGSWPGGGGSATNGPVSMYFVGVPVMGYAKATKAILASTGTFSSMGFYSHAPGNVRLAIYNNASGAPSAKQWESGNLPVAANVFTTVNISSGTPSTLTLNAGTYWLAWQWNSVASGPSYTSGSAGDGNFIVQSYGAFPATWTGGTNSSEKWSVDASFCTIITTSATQTNITCFSNSDGTITVTGNGGTSPYTFSIDNGANYTSTPAATWTFSGLAPNTAYKIRVKDNVGCESKLIQ